MDCWHCGSELIWGGDHDYEDGDGYGEGEGIVSNFSCPPVPPSFTSIYRLKKSKNQPKPLKASSAILAERKSKEKHLFAPCLLLV